jgi:hypothetical protein
MLFLVATTSWVIGQTGTSTSDSKTTTDKAKPAVHGLESLKNLPPGAIIVICKDLDKAQKLRPDLILLTPREHQELLDEIVRLKGKLQTVYSKPGECHLKGKVQGDLVQLQADFKFMTESDGEHVLLACQSARPTAANLDGNFPLLLPSDKGFVLKVEKKGTHVAHLEMEVNLTPKGDRASERGFDLDLPRAAVTNLELELPEEVKAVAVGVNPARTGSRLVRTSVQDKHAHLSQKLGAVDSIELMWKGPAPASSAPLVRTAQGLISVRLFEQYVTTDAKLTLRSRGQPANLWRLHVPPNAVVTVKPQTNEERIPAEIESPNGPADPIRLVRLREPSFEPIEVVVHVRQERAQGAAPIGPFAVEGAALQHGDILVATPANTRLRFFPHGMVSQREASADEQLKDFKIAFRYWTMPSGEPKGQPFPPLLEVDAESSSGTVEARVSHRLQKTDEVWKLTTVIEATPVSSAVDTLSVQLPAGYTLANSLASRTDYSIQNSPTGASVAEIKLKQKQSKRFQVTLEGTFPGTAELFGKVILGLPQPLQVVPRAGGPHEVKILAADNVEFEAPKGSDPTWQVTRERYNRQTWTSDHVPERIEIAWKPHQQQLLLSGTADVTVSARVAKVLQQVWFASGQAPAEVQLDAPKGANDDLQVLERGEWNSEDRVITLSKDVSEKRPLKLLYSFSIRGVGKGALLFPVPLAIPRQREARCEMKLRVACEPGTLAERAAGPWEELPVEATADGAQLASLVLRGDRLTAPPILRLSQVPFDSLGSVDVEKVLIRASVTDQGEQSYRASFLLQRASLPYLDIELPAPPTGLNVRFALGGLPANWGPVDDNAPTPAGSGDPPRIARVKLGAGLIRPTILDVWYSIGLSQLPNRSASWTRALGPVQAVLYPPRLCGHSSRASVRWQIVLPPDWVPLYEDGAYSQGQKWAWRGWLLAARPATSAVELERWLTQTEELAEAEENESSAYPSVTSWRTDLEPLQVVHVPQQPWLLGCSLVLLTVGLGLYLAQPSRLLNWSILVLLGTGAAVFGVLWPGVLSAIIYGCEPGLLALVVVVGLQWVLHQRYRRQVVFLPSFKRVKGGASSLVHNGNSRSRREPSTVDAPSPDPTSQRTAESGSAHGSVRTK